MTIAAGPAPAYLLPPRAYFDPAWHDAEVDRLFQHRWALVAAVDDLTRPGDYVATRVGRSPLVVVRGDDGGLRAFHNLCRHRGMAMLDGCGNTGRAIGCFYHQWRYGLDGSLQVVPQRREQFPDLDADALGLLPASVATWGGFVFAHPDPGAPALADAMGGWPDELGSHRPASLPLMATVSYELGCNWKLFVENHIDVYHLWYLHERSLAAFDHTRFDQRFVGEHWVSYEPPRAAPPPPATSVIGHLAARDRAGIGAHLFFPNVMVACGAEFFSTYVAVPVAVDRTRLELRIRGEADADPAVLRGLMDAFLLEDIQACEAIQGGLRSPAFAVGPLARDHEAPITRFHELLLDALGGDA